MSFAPRALALVLSLTAGCLQSGSMPEGFKIVSGRDVGSIRILANDDGPWGITYSQRIAQATPEKGAVSDLWVAPFPEEIAKTLPGYVSPIDLPVTQPIRVASNRSDSWWPWPAGRSMFLMVDERQMAAGGEGKGQMERVGTLQRIDTSHYLTDLRFENISTFSLASENRMLFRQVPTDQTPGIFLWDGTNQRRLGDAANPGQVNMQFGGRGRAYFVLGSERLLSRLGGLDEPVENLYAGVRGFSLSGDERYVVLAADEAGKTVTFALDLDTGKKLPFDRPNPCCWRGWASDTIFTYSETAGVNTPAEYHTVNVATGEETCLVLPAALSDLADFRGRADSDEVLYLDSKGHGVFFGPDQKPLRTVLKPGTDLPARMLTPSFSPDGKYLLYIDEQPRTDAEPYARGPLLVQPVDLSEPARALTVPGMSVQANSYFFISGPSEPIQGPNGPLTAPNEPILVFWGYVVRASTDLYFANHVTGDLKVVTGAIGDVTVDSQRIFGTANLSAQDVVGDLMVWNVPTQTGRTISRAVPQYEFTSGYGLVSYVFRGRAASDHDGIWVTTMNDPQAKHDGGH